MPPRALRTPRSLPLAAQALDSEAPPELKIGNRSMDRSLILCPNSLVSSALLDECVVHGSSLVHPWRSAEDPGGLSPHGSIHLART
mmetsp:Transcript_2847/g.6640  ORF Transcript_2847/g.6640 Transcript_2847/m.6640 type:complete len:86 (-) Transcript_2847:29-286(-)